MGIGKLSRAFSDLKLRLAENWEQWHDVARRDFEENYLHDLPIQLQQTLVAVQRLEEILQQAEKECGDEPEILDA
jgi:hypothetical protein